MCDAEWGGERCCLNLHRPVGNVLQAFVTEGRSGPRSASPIAQRLPSLRYMDCSALNMQFLVAVERG